MQKAVLDIASIFDQTGEGSSSLPTALDLITRHLKSSTSGSLQERLAARDLVNQIRQDAIQNKSSEVEYVRYVRNKWAAHTSMDIHVDTWEDGKIIDFDKLEAALDQLRQHFLDLASLTTLVESVKDWAHDARRVDEKVDIDVTQLSDPELAKLARDGRVTPQATYKIGLDWEGALSWPVDFMGSIGKSAAQHLLERILPR
ncbi:hypothetical protein [Citricoccus sp. I39-566]|uniref:hypothetical protein n=1 Tax=Citricoccus sp. I39-566 TaxID=3073268 RepID=UPI00286A795A|nr:hypothetical protein [Citricoccus sp. I39-566]WMY79419.1 hypothetical protein RE421_06020 [Citricoccus sp. I39-566]